MRIQYASDLHIEFGSRPLRKSDIKGDVLVLSGDIAGKPEQLAQSLRLLSGDVPILYVMGNHEFFGHDFALDPGHYRKAIEGFPHVYLLEDRMVIIQGVRFLGCTLWTDFFGGVQGPSSERGMNDFEYITLDGGNLRWTDVADRHRKSLAWLRKELEFSGLGPVRRNDGMGAVVRPGGIKGGTDANDSVVLVKGDVDERLTKIVRGG